MRDIDPEPYEGPVYTKLSERVQRARKQHKCQWCPEPIEPGQLYYVAAFIEDGVFSTITAHTRNGECAYEEG